MRQATITRLPYGPLSGLPPSTIDLVVVRVVGDFLVHLTEQWRHRSLCGRTLRSRPPLKSFRRAACAACLSSALDDGQIAVLEGDRAWINLLRV